MSTGKLKRGTPESVIEAYLVERVREAGAFTEKHVSPGRRGVPDRIVIWPRYGWAKVDFVELKAPLGKLDPLQVEDHAVRDRYGCYVWVIWTREQVDNYVRNRLDGHNS